METTPCRLRIRLDSGFEIETEGPQDFIRQERDYFLQILTKQTPQERFPASIKIQDSNIPPKPALTYEQIWGKAVEGQGGNLVLRGKLKDSYGEKEASLVLLAASEFLLKIRKPTAFQLAKWLRNSGYPIQRIDRLLQEAVQKGEVLASGSRRARRYELTLVGKSRASFLANELASLIE